MSVTIVNSAITNTTIGEQTYIPAYPIQTGLVYELDTSTYNVGDIGIYEQVNNILFILYGGSRYPSYSSDNKGIFNFNGINTELTGYYNGNIFVSDQTNLNYANAPYYSCSLSIWVKTQSTQSQTFYGHGGIINGIALGTSGSYYIAAFSSASVIERIQYQATSSLGTWVNLTGVYTSGSLSLYLNDTLVNQTSSNLIAPINQGSNPPSIGFSDSAILSQPVGLESVDHFTGSFGVFLKYNRDLTSQEVAYNYNQYKTRFGL